MLITFDGLKDMVISNMNGGDGEISAKPFVDRSNKIMLCRLLEGSSIGMHTHDTSSEIDYVLEGEGEAVCDGAEEHLIPGTCHYCPRGSTHSIRNIGNRDLVLLTVVPEQ